MKFYHLLLCLPLLAAPLVSCGGDDEDEPRPSQPEGPTQPTEPSKPEQPDTLPSGEDPDNTEKKLTLVWQDDFDAAEVDTAVWSRIPQGSPDWAKCQSLDDRCYEKRSSSIVLRGIVNNDKSNDSRDYLCGGLWTRGKKAFEPGRIEVRARMTNARGAWPAIWMMPFKSELGWPFDGEIDIMEHLNYDGTVYQTLHSGYIDNEGHRYNPLYSIQPAVNNLSAFHTYGVEISEDKVEFYLDGELTLTYPKLDVAGQFPYYREWDLRLDMQLGGSWVGSVAASTLPVELEIDWVKYYQYK